MTEMTMLDLDDIDLRNLAAALEDHSHDTLWFFDPASGSVMMRSAYSKYFGDSAEDEEPDELGWIRIEPESSSEGYRDMADFIAQVRDPRARDLLDRAIAGRGAFRRFKDTLFEFPELREAWFTFHDRRMQRRAVEWLMLQGLADEAPATAALDRLQDPDLPGLNGRFDPEDVAAAVAADLRRLYGSRMRKVVLFGSWARDDADDESDLDLLVVLESMESPFAEIDRMSDVVWPHAQQHGIAISVVPVRAEDERGSKTAFLRRVRAEGRAVA
jgi:predicted nucleotidyltransferase